MQKDEEQASVLTRAVLVLLVLIVFVHPLISRLFGKKEIGAFFEAQPPYTTKYYVYLFPREGYKNYKLVGDIYVDEDCYGGGREWECSKYIQLETVKFGDKGDINFNDCYIESGRTPCADDGGKEWIIEFHGERVE